MKSKFRLFGTVTVCMVLLLSFTLLFPDRASGAIINNADVIPKWVPDSEVAVDSNGEPEWVKSLIMAEVNLQLATPEGTLASSYKVLDHYQELGVNGLWLLPIHDNGSMVPSQEVEPNTLYSYGGLGFDTIHPKLTGETDYAKGWKVFDDFLKAAHDRGIRIFLDITSWGFSGPTLIQEQHPDWFGAGTYSAQHSFNWSSSQFKEWYIGQIVDLGMRVPIDGYRYDVEPQLAGYSVHREIRKRLEANGRKMLYMPELENDRLGVYTVGQGRGGEVNYNMAWDGKKQAYPFLDGWNIVDCIKNGQNIGSSTERANGEGAIHRYYVNGFSDHDRGYYNIRGNRAVIGYQGIFAPFIPLWYMGEEFNNNRYPTAGWMSLFYFGLHWNERDIPENRSFFEDLKANIRIRRQYPEIFEYFPESLRDTNICKVTVSGLEDVQAYARYAGDTAMLIVPNINSHNKKGDMTVYVPFNEAEIAGYAGYTVTNAKTGEVIAKGNASKISRLKVTVPYEDQIILKVQGFDKLSDSNSTGGESIVGNNSEIESNGNNSSNDNNDVQGGNSDNSNVDESDNSGEQSEASAVNGESKAGKPGYYVPGERLPVNILWIILPCVGGVILLGGGVLTFVLIKKKSK